MKKTVHYSCISALLLTIACSGEKQKATTTTTPEVDQTELKKTEWLIGSWRGTFPEGCVGETWEKQSDSLFSGRGFFVMGADTVSKETLRLLSEGGQVYYEPTVSKQNDGKAVRFKMTLANETDLVFENPEHDFPQKISYHRIGSDSLLAEISGQQKGAPRTETFPMRRQQ